MLRAEALRLGYGGGEVVRGIDLRVEAGEVVALLGPNGSGKSTLLRGLARLLRPSGGTAFLDGKALAGWSSTELARRLALLAQTHEPVEDLTVRELAALGRHPHQGFLQMASVADRRAVERALAQSDTTALADRKVSELSGGERQRAWLALALAGDPAVLLLDEPTAFLDLAHQLAVLDLVRHLNQQRGLTVVMALHDLGQAARYADRVVLLRDGAVMGHGAPLDVLTPAMIRAAYGVDAEIVYSRDGVPAVVPLRTVT